MRSKTVNVSHTLDVDFQLATSSAYISLRMTLAKPWMSSAWLITIKLFWPGMADLYTKGRRYVPHSPCCKDYSSREQEQGEAVTVDGDRYRVFLNEFLFTKIEEDTGNIWFQQDCATCHTVEATLDVLRRRADVVWSPRSSDLTPLDYYLWSAVKPEKINALKDNIREANWWNTVAHNR